MKWLALLTAGALLAGCAGSAPGAAPAVPTDTEPHPAAATPAAATPGATPAAAAPAATPGTNPAPAPQPGTAGIHDFGGTSLHREFPTELQPLGEALRDGRLADATRLHQQLKPTKDVDYLRLTGELLQLQGRFREAAVPFSQAVQQDPDDLALVFDAYEMEMYRDPRKAEELIRHALKRHPRVAALHLCRAEALILSTVVDGVDRTAEASVEAARCRRLGGITDQQGRPTGDVEAVLGEIALLRKDLRTAQRHFQRAIEQGIDNPDRGIDVANAWGYVSYRLQDLDTARRAWQKGAEIWQAWDGLSFFRLTSKGEVLLFYLDVFCGVPLTKERLDWIYQNDENLMGRGFEAEGTYRTVRGWSYDFVEARKNGDWATALDRILKLKGSGPVERPQVGREDILCFYFYQVDAPMAIACDSILAGDMLRKLGQETEAREQYLEAQRLLPDDPLIRKRLER